MRMRQRSVLCPRCRGQVTILANMDAATYKATFPLECDKECDYTPWLNGIFHGEHQPLIGPKHKRL